MDVSEDIGIEAGGFVTTQDIVTPGPTDGGTTQPAPVLTDQGCAGDIDCGVVEVLPCQAATCDVTKGLCVIDRVPDGESCDTDPCAVDQVCTAGACAGGAPRDCDDGDPCTLDTCGAAGCESALDDSVCCPTCVDKVCGDDGCGGDCGTCSVGTTCNDEGQCAEGCGPGEFLGCLGACVPATIYGDGACDEALNCLELHYDGGDCTAGC
ncbi:MAG: hypothetical protein QF464_16600, partial [Myxococcota bacterium]|nr:hypothetical protein [Myxococcota bacterium]